MEHEDFEQLVKQAKQRRAAYRETLLAGAPQAAEPHCLITEPHADYERMVEQARNQKAEYQSILARHPGGGQIWLTAPAPEASWADRNAQINAKQAAELEADRQKPYAQRKREAARKRTQATKAQRKGVAACMALGMPADCPDPLAWILDKVEVVQATEYLMQEAEHLADEAGSYEAWAAAAA